MPHSQYRACTLRLVLLSGGTASQDVSFLWFDVPIRFDTHGHWWEVRGHNISGQSASQICIGGQNAGLFWGRVDKMPVSPNQISMKKQC